MPRYIVKLTDSRDGKDYYLDWSTVVDAPVGGAIGYEAFESYYVQTYGTDSIYGLDKRMERVRAKGTSAHLYESGESLISFNMVGYGVDEIEGNCATPEQIIDIMFKNQS